MLYFKHNVPTCAREMLREHLLVHGYLAGAPTSGG